jgi:hypothetical protein
MAGVIGYWLDRSLFPYARPDSFLVAPEDEVYDIDLSSIGGECKLPPWRMVANDGFVFAITMLRRAVIVGCAMLAIGLGA